MDTTMRTKQGGSVAIFLVVSVVLAALVIGGVYAVQNRGAYVRTNEPVAINEGTQKTPTPAPDTAKDNADDKANDTNKDSNANEEAQKQAQQQKKQENEAAKQQAATEKAAREKAEAEKKQQEQAVAQSETIPQTSTAQQHAGSLPTTGPEDSLLQIVAGAILTAIILAYLKSYRHRFGSLRQ